MIFRLNNQQIFKHGLWIFKFVCEKFQSPTFQQGNLWYILEPFKYQRYLIKRCQLLKAWLTWGRCPSLSWSSACRNPSTIISVTHQYTAFDRKFTYECTYFVCSRSGGGFSRRAFLKKEYLWKIKSSINISIHYIILGCKHGTACQIYFGKLRWVGIVVHYTFPLLFLK